MLLRIKVLLVTVLPNISLMKTVLAEKSGYERRCVSVVLKAGSGSGSRNGVSSFVVGGVHVTEILTT